MDQVPLGKKVGYSDTYDPNLLCPISRKLGRSDWMKKPIEMHGFDRWTSLELSWLNEQGKPQAGILQWIVPSNSPNLIESKSCKLYLNSFNQTKMSRSEVHMNVTEDFSTCAGTDVQVQIMTIEAFEAQSSLAHGKSICLDDLPISCDTYQVTPSLLKSGQGKDVTESLYTTLYKSNCLVTNQPDWASVWVHYQGKPIDRESLLRYLISYRMHQGFHEPCVERILYDLHHELGCKQVTVEARYTRRGGIDIHPVRSLTPVSVTLGGRQFRQ